MFGRGRLGKPPSAWRLSFARWRVLGSMGDGAGSLAVAQDAVPLAAVSSYHFSKIDTVPPASARER
jgi:hypothetical protein